MISSSAPQKLTTSDFAFKAKELLPQWKSQKPSTVKQRNGTVKTRTITSTSQVDCTNVLYKKPDAQSSE